MKYLFTLCLLVFSLSASAQWQQTGAKVRYVNGLGIPTKDTAAGVAADSSQILIRPQDSALYVKYKRTWLRVGGGTVSGTPNRVSKFTGATTVGNSSIVDSASAVAMTINTSGRIGIGTTTPVNRFDVRDIGNTYPFFVIGNNQTSGIALGTDGSNNALIQGINSNFLTSNKLSLQATGGNALIGTNTDNGVDRLQVSGSMNVSARATVQSLSVTNDITARTIYSGSDQAGSVDGLVITAGNEKGFVINNTNTTGVASQSRFTFKNNGADRGLFYYSEAAQTFSFQSSGASRNIQIASEGGVGFYMTGANTNVRIGESVASNAPLSVNGFALINTNTNNSVDALQVNGAIQGNGLRQAYLARTTAYTITNNDYLIDCTSGTFTVTLPASSGRTGRIFIIKNSGAGTITVDGNASETIDGAATYSLATQYATVQIMCDGGNWKIISKF